MIILIIFIVFVIIVINCNMNEHMENIGIPQQNDNPTDETLKFSGTFTTFNGRMAIDDQYFYDKLFDDVAYYDNTYDRDTGALISTGWDTCVTKCSGHCVEYGVVGSSYCFPY